MINLPIGISNNFWKACCIKGIFFSNEKLIAFPNALPKSSISSASDTQNLQNKQKKLVKHFLIKEKIKFWSIEPYPLSLHYSTNRNQPL